MKYFIIALQFLSLVPAKLKQPPQASDFGKALVYFPLAGLVLGLILAGLALVLKTLPYPLLILLILLASTLITGGLHLDGFADSCDGLGINADCQTRLAVMRQGQVGAFAVIGLILLILFKFTMFLLLKKTLLIKTIIFIFIFSRLCQSLSCCLSGYARQQGKAKDFIAHAPKKMIFANTVLFFIATFVFYGWSAIMIWLFSLTVIYLFIRFAKLRLGGITGDIIGAINELAETSALLGVLLWS